MIIVRSAQVEQVIILTEFEKSDYPNRPGVQRFSKIIRFATIPAVKAGWLCYAKYERVRLLLVVRAGN